MDLRKAHLGSNRCSSLCLILWLAMAITAVGVVSDCAAEGYYVVNNRGPTQYAGFQEAETYMRTGDPQWEGLVLKTTSIGSKSATWYYDVPSIPIAFGAPYYRGGGIEAAEEGAIVDYVTSGLLYPRAGMTVCEIKEGPTALDDWSAFPGEIWGDPFYYLRQGKTYQWKYTWVFGTDCSNPSDDTLTVGIERITPFSCPPQTPMWDFSVGLCKSLATGSITFWADGAGYYLSADNTTRSTPPAGNCEAQGGNPTEGNPCDAITGDKIERAVDYTSPGGLELSRVFTTPTGKWTFDFEGRVNVRSPMAYVPYAGVGKKSAFFSMPEEACEHGWRQIVTNVDPTFVGATAVMSGSRCLVQLAGVTRFELEVHAYYDGGTPPASGLYIQEPDGRALHFENHEGVWVAVDGGVRRQIAVRGERYIIDRGPGEVEEYDLNGQLVRYTRAGQSFTVTRIENQVIVADEFGRSYTATYEGGHVAHVDLPDQTTIDYTYEGANLTQVTFSKGTSHEIEGYSYETKGSLTLLSTHSFNGVPYASWSYDDLGRATTSTHAGGAGQVAFEYHDGYTRLSRPLGDVRLLHTVPVKEAARLSYIDDGNGKVYEQRAYDPNGFLQSRTDALGHVTTYVHDSLGRETSRTEAAGTDLARTTVTTWDPDHIYLPATITTPTLVTEYTYTTVGRIRTRTETDRVTGKQRITSITYTDLPEGRLITIDGPRTDVADITQIKYDPAGNLTTVIDALGHTTVLKDHDGSGRPKTIIDPNGAVVLLDYDLRGRLKLRKVGSEATRLTYTKAGDLKTVTLPSGEKYTYSYDDARRLYDVKDSAGNRIRYELDALGNRTEEKVFAADGTKTRHLHQLFDTLGQLWQTLKNSGEVTAEYSYNDNGALSTVTDGRAHTTAGTYDALNRLQEVTDPLNNVATYSYRSDDLIASVTDPNRNTTTYHYDGFGNLLRQESPDTGVTTFPDHDDAGNLLTRIDAKGQRSSYTYDALNRLTTATYPDGTITYAYDTAPNGIGRLASIRDGSGTTSFGYDKHGRVTTRRQKILGASLATTYGYTAGRLTRITYPSGMVVEYKYAGEKVTDVLMNGATLLADIVYEPFGGPTRWTFANGQSYQRTFNLDGRLKSHTLGDETRELRYDPVWNITRLVGTAPTQLGYDPLNRLSSADNRGFHLSWDYDANGNRQHQISGGKTTTYEYTPGTNRLSAIDGEVYAVVNHDENGNRRGDANHTYQYDPRDRLLSVDEGATALYLYNALGQRVRKQTAAGTRLFAYDGWKLLGEYDESRTVVQETVWLGDLPVVTVQSGVSYYIHPDHLGTPRVIADQSGRTVWRWESEPFGSEEANEDPDGDGVRVEFNLRFPGQYYDGETGLNYNYFRDYDPTTGRYIESDPIGLAGGLNPYTYTSGNPINAVDPFGLDETTIIVPAPPFVFPPGSPGYDATLNALNALSDAMHDAVDASKKACSDNDDDDFCYKRWEQEDSRCWQWKGLGTRVVQACQDRAADRRSLCNANGGKPNPSEPPEYNPFVDYPR